MTKEQLLAKYSGVQIPWGPIGEQVYRRTYSQVKPVGRKEAWPETVVRAVLGNMALAARANPGLATKYANKNITQEELFQELIKLGMLAPDEGERLVELLMFFDGLPAGRHLNASGIPGREFLFNCHSAGFCEDDPAAHFTFTFDSLMQGGGVGSNYSNRYVDLLPKIETSIDLHIVCREDHPDLEEFYQLLTEVVPTDRASHHDIYYVDDSREGWVDSIGFILEKAWGRHPGSGREEKIVLDVSRVRPRGSPLKTSGGIACGPGPLVSMLADFTKHLNSCFDRKLTTLDVMILDHTVASCVVAGGKRRSSRMSVKNWQDRDVFEFINCKREDGSHWTTNISVETDEEFEAAYRAGNQHARDVARAVVLGCRSNGEPGFWNRSLSMKDEREPELMFCPNPCVTGETRVMTEAGLVRIKDMVGRNGSLAVDRRFGVGTSAQTTQAGAFKTGTKPVLLLKTKEGYRLRLTYDHKVMTVDGWQEASQIQPGTIIHIANTEGMFGQLGGGPLGALAGWLTGDGCLLKEENNTPRFYFYGDDRHLIENMLSAAESLTGVRPTISEYDANKRLHFESAALREHLGTMTENKFRIPEFVWRGTRECQQMYLSALFSADGSVQGTTEKGASIRLSSSHTELLHDVQMLLLNFGIATKLYEERRPAGMRDLPDGKGGYKSYFCNADHELMISKANFPRFAAQIDFIHNGKKEKLAEALQDRTRGFYKETFTATVVSLQDDGVEDVYDVQVPGPNAFIANGLVVHNCGEIGLQMWENCCLGHINLQAFANRRPALAYDAFRLMTRWLMRATFGDIPNPRQREVVNRNRRIGVGFFGYHGFTALRGIKYSESWKSEEVIRMLKACKDTIAHEAYRYAQILGIPVPVKTTTVAPTGSVAALPGTSTGDQSIYAPFYKRLVRYSDMDPELAIKKLEGYITYVDPDARNTSIVEYWCEDPLVAKVRATGIDPAVIEAQDEIPFEDSLRVQAMIQTHWADNAVSHTINLPYDRMGSEDEMEATLLKYHSLLKGTTIFPDKSRRNAPLQRLTSEQFDTYQGRKEVAMVEVECVSGCPVR